MEICYATGNKEKVNRLREALIRYDLKDVEILQIGLELPEFQSDDINHIAREKARYAFSQLRNPCLVQDSGFFIDALNGFPGVFVKYVAKTINLKGITKLLSGVTNRGCSFKDCLVYYDGNDFHYFQSDTRGFVSLEERGDNVEWPLHKIFIPEGENKTLAEMTKQEKEDWRIRRDQDYYANQFAKWIKNKS